MNHKLGHSNDAPSPNRDPSVPGEMVFGGSGREGLSASEAQALVTRPADTVIAQVDPEALALDLISMCEIQRLMDSEILLEKEEFHWYLDQIEVLAIRAELKRQLAFWWQKAETVKGLLSKPEVATNAVQAQLGQIKTIIAALESQLSRLG